MEQIDGIMLETEKPKLLITATPEASIVTGKQIGRAHV